MKTIFYNGRERKISPLLMKPDLVAQTLLGVKTETRRLSGLDNINVDPDNFKFVNNSIDWPDMPRLAKKYDRTVYYAFNQKHSNQILFVCYHNYGRVGDILFVRENFYQQGHWAIGAPKNTWVPRHNMEVKYEADGLVPKSYSDHFYHWRHIPNIHLPFKLTRLFLEITEVGLERLQDITQEDARAEGVYTKPHRPASEGCKQHQDGSLSRDCFVCAFKHIWNVINGERGYAWDKNPFVFVIRYKRVEIDPKTATKI